MNRKGSKKSTGLERPNKNGLSQKDNPEWDSYYTKILQAAYNIGLDGIDISTAPIVNATRAGKAPWDGISVNHKPGESENGLSCLSINGGEEHWSASFVGNRERHEYTGILLPITGSDDEPLILPVDGFENFD